MKCGYGNCKQEIRRICNLCNNNFCEGHTRRCKVCKTSFCNYHWEPHKHAGHPDFNIRE